MSVPFVNATVKKSNVDCHGDYLSFLKLNGKPKSLKTLANIMHIDVELLSRYSVNNHNTSSYTSRNYV